MYSFFYFKHNCYEFRSFLPMFPSSNLLFNIRFDQYILTGFSHASVADPSLWNFEWKGQHSFFPRISFPHTVISRWNGPASIIADSIGTVFYPHVPLTNYSFIYPLYFSQGTCFSRETDSHEIHYIHHMDTIICQE